MSESAIKAGDTVQLKSGGPIMTVRWVEGDQAYCEWFDKTDLKGSKLAVISLAKAEF